jgi:hypothetical protein
MVMTLSAPAVSIKLATNFPVIGALDLSFLSCLAYPKEGITYITVKLKWYYYRRDSLCRSSLYCINHNEQLHQLIFITEFGLHETNHLDLGQL